MQAELTRIFGYHKPTPSIAKVHEAVREAHKNLAEFVLRLPHCRERSLAITKLEESMLWANAAIARNHDAFAAEPDGEAQEG